MEQDLFFAETDSRHEAQPDMAGDATTWISPDFVEVSTCAEICAYVFVAT